MIDFFPEFTYRRWDIHLVAQTMICSWQHPNCELTLCQVEWPRGIAATLHLIVENKKNSGARGVASPPVVLGINSGFGEIMAMVDSKADGTVLGEKIFELNPELVQLVFAFAPDIERLAISPVAAKDEMKNKYKGML